MYEKVSPELNFKQREKEVLSFWQKNDIFQKSMTQVGTLHQKVPGKRLDL